MQLVEDAGHGKDSAILALLYCSWSVKEALSLLAENHVGISVSLRGTTTWAGGLDAPAPAGAPQDPATAPQDRSAADPLNSTTTPTVAPQSAQPLGEPEPTEDPTPSSSCAEPAPSANAPAPAGAQAASSAKVAANPWNAFQQRLGGSGMSQGQMLARYREESGLAELIRSNAPPLSAASSGAEGHADLPHPYGYLVLRTPPSQRHLRGAHCASWATLMARFGITRQDWPRYRDQYYLLNIERVSDLEAVWTAEGFTLPIPKH